VSSRVGEKLNQSLSRSRLSDSEAGRKSAIASHNRQVAAVIAPQRTRSRDLSIPAALESYELSAISYLTNVTDEAAVLGEASVWECA